MRYTHIVETWQAGANKATMLNPSQGKWGVRSDNLTVVRDIFDTEAEAVAEAQEMYPRTRCITTADPDHSYNF